MVPWILLAMLSQLFCVTDESIAVLAANSHSLRVLDVRGHALISEAALTAPAGCVAQVQSQQVVLLKSRPGMHDVRTTTWRVHINSNDKPHMLVSAC